MQTLDVKRMATLVKQCAGNMGVTVVANFAQTRDEEDRFARSMYNSARTAFMRNLEEALTIRDVQQRHRVR